MLFKTQSDEIDGIDCCSKDMIYRYNNATEPSIFENDRNFLKLNSFWYNKYVEYSYFIRRTIPYPIFMIKEHYNVHLSKRILPLIDAFLFKCSRCENMAYNNITDVSNTLQNFERLPHSKYQAFECHGIRRQEWLQL